MTSTGAVAGVAFLAYLEHPLAPRPRPGQIVVLDRLGGAPQTGGAGGDRSAGVRVGAVAWVRPGLQPQRVGFQQDRGVRESCGGEDEGERWTQRSRLRWGRCRWGMWWVGLSMPESRITHCENRCMTGKFYVPLDPAQSPSELATILTELAAQLILTDDRHYIFGSGGCRGRRNHPEPGPHPRRRHQQPSPGDRSGRPRLRVLYHRFDRAAQGRGRQSPERSAQRHALHQQPDDRPSRTGSACCRFQASVGLCRASSRRCSTAPVWCQ